MLSYITAYKPNRADNPTRAACPVGGASGYIYFYPLNIRLKLNMI